MTAAASKGTVSALMDRVSGKLSEGGQAKGLKRRTATFLLKKELCEPDAFEEDITVEIGGLSAKEEHEALKDAGDGASTVFAMAKLAIRTIDGEVVRREARNVVWDALGFGGRTAVVNHFATHILGNITASEEGSESPLSASLGKPELG